jgi:hypothetical protein
MKHTVQEARELTADIQVCLEYNIWMSCGRYCISVAK